MISVEQLIRDLNPSKTVLFFGAGSSMPSGLPSGNDLLATISKDFGIDASSFNLAEASLLAELKTNRKDLIKSVRAAIGRPQPTGALLNLPLYNWKSLFTTNYDELIEVSYQRRSVKLIPYHTNFDFSKIVSPGDHLLFKLHGTINEDIADGSKSRLIITQSDYDKTMEFRESIFDRFAADLAGADLIVIGQRLDDPDIKAVIDRALAIQSKLHEGAGTISLLLYERDEGRALLYENRGIRVCFGGIDDFFAALAAHSAKDNGLEVVSDDPLDRARGLRPATVDIQHAISAFKSNVSAMFAGRAASFSDIDAGLTFSRTVANGLYKKFQDEPIICAGILGASGVGKTTAARQVAVSFARDGWLCWEHKTDLSLNSASWCALADDLLAKELNGLLIVDDAHVHLAPLNDILDHIAKTGNAFLRIIYISSKNHWKPRVKTPIMHRNGVERIMSSLNTTEIDRLINLVERSDVIRPLVENSFSGFSRQQKRNRLIERCEQDMFVCLKNIFASESFDNIILREFNETAPDVQGVYRIVAAMESLGVRVHRQLVLRVLRERADRVAEILDKLEDIVFEYEISERQHIYGWKVRHKVIADILCKYKFSNYKDVIDLLDLTISNLSPTYEIERRTIREICDTGLSRVPDRKEQNRLLRRLISLAPGERVPRHRLIRNLIEDDKFELAQTEIKVFERDIGRDGPIARYRASLLLARAIHSKGIAESDRIVILRQAHDEAKKGQRRFTNNRALYGISCDIGIHLFKMTKDLSIFDEALSAMKKAEAVLDDPDFTKLLRSYERKGFGLYEGRTKVTLVDSESFNDSLH